MLKERGHEPQKEKVFSQEPPNALTTKLKGILPGLIFIAPEVSVIPESGVIFEEPVPPVLKEGEEEKRPLLTAQEEKRLSVKIFSGKLALRALEKILESPDLTSAQEEKMRDLLREPRAKLFLTNFNLELASWTKGQTKDEFDRESLKVVARYDAWLAFQLERNSPSQAFIDRQLTLYRQGDRAFEKLVTANLGLVRSVAGKYYDSQDLELEHKDRVGYGNEGLIIAAVRFDWRRGTRFSTYATHRIRQKISRAIADHDSTIRLPVHMHELLSQLAQKREQLTQKQGKEIGLEGAIKELGIGEETEKSLGRAIKTLGVVSLNGIVQDGESTELGDLIADKTEGPLEETVGQVALCEQVKEALGKLSPQEYKILKLRFGIGDGRSRTLKEVGREFDLTRERIRQIEAKALRRLKPELQSLVEDQDRGPKTLTRRHKMHVGRSGKRNEGRKEPLANPQRREALTSDQEKELLVNLTCVISSNLAAENLQRISRDLLRILENCTSPEAMARLETINGSRERLEELLIRGVAVTLKRLWEPSKTDLVSVKERQIMAYCAQLKQGGTSLEAVVGNICHHFSVPIAVALQGWTLRA